LKEYSTIFALCQFQLQIHNGDARTRLRAIQQMIENK